MWPIWGRQDPGGGPHVGPMNLAIWVSYVKHELGGKNLTHIVVIEPQNLAISVSKNHVQLTVKRLISPIFRVNSFVMQERMNLDELFHFTK